MNANENFIATDPRVDPSRVIRAPRGTTLTARAGSPKPPTA
jgi:hypothetical protein